jgi:hypothetical protein
MRRTLLAGAALVGAAVVGLVWLFAGTGSNSGASGALSSLGQAPGIAPPDYAYLDDAQVALYLGQLQGGLATSEQLTEQLSQGKTAGVSAGGLSLGGSTSSQASAERVVTPTATARFYQLLDLLGRDGYLHKIDAASSPANLKQAFANVPEGSFVELDDCRLMLPTFVQMLQISRASNGTESPYAVFLAATQAAETNSSAPTRYDEIEQALRQAGLINHATGSAALAESPQRQQRLGRAITALDKVGSDPRVPLSTCDGAVDTRPRGVDWLFPIRLANLSSEQSLLAGPVTLVGKLVRAVRGSQRNSYVDDASFATFGGPVQRIDSSQGQSVQALWNELDADAVVLSPGAVILPIAIYK